MPSVRAWRRCWRSGGPAWPARPGPTCWPGCWTPRRSTTPCILGLGAPGSGEAAGLPGEPSLTGLAQLPGGAAAAALAELPGPGGGASGPPRLGADNAARAAGRPRGR